MVSVLTPMTRRALQPGEVVIPAEGITGVQTPDGRLILRHRLGPGIVEKVAPTGQVRVRWMDAEFDIWMDPVAVEPAGAHTHMITVYQCDGRGSAVRLGHHVITAERLEYNWTVELRPDNLIRMIRADGHSWTFYAFCDTRCICTPWPQPSEDTDGEALAAAELAVGWSWTQI
jgi:hypothetical protein